MTQPNIQATQQLINEMLSLRAQFENVLNQLAPVAAAEKPADTAEAKPAESKEPKPEPTPFDKVIAAWAESRTAHWNEMAAIRRELASLKAKRS